MAQEEQFARHLAWDACYNVRDLGDYPTEDGGRIRRGALVRADNLGRLTSAGQAAVRTYGIRTIIDLRLAYELEKQPNPFAAPQEPDAVPRYLNLPLHDPATNTALDAAAPQEEYILIVERNKELVGAVIKAVAANLGEGGVLVHCHGGKDRTGIVVALLLAVAGVLRATIIEDYTLSEARLAAPTAAWLEEQIRVQGRPMEIPHWQLAPPYKIVGLLDYLDREYGGVAGYLVSIGVLPDEMAEIRRYLLAPAADASS